MSYTFPASVPMAGPSMPIWQGAPMQPSHGPQAPGLQPGAYPAAPLLGPGTSEADNAVAHQLMQRLNAQFGSTAAWLPTLDSLARVCNSLTPAEQDLVQRHLFPASASQLRQLEQRWNDPHAMADVLSHEEEGVDDPADAGGGTKAGPPWEQGPSGRPGTGGERWHPSQMHAAYGGYPGQDLRSARGVPGPAGWTGPAVPPGSTGKFPASGPIRTAPMPSPSTSPAPLPRPGATAPMMSPPGTPTSPAMASAMTPPAWTPGPAYPSGWSGGAPAGFIGQGLAQTAQWPGVAASPYPAPPPVVFAPAPFIPSPAVVWDACGGFVPYPSCQTWNFVPGPGWPAVGFGMSSPLAPCWGDVSAAGVGLGLGAGIGAGIGAGVGHMLGAFAFGHHFF